MLPKLEALNRYLIRVLKRTRARARARQHLEYDEGIVQGS